MNYTYEKTVYVNDNPPAINSSNLNKSETGIFNAMEGINDCLKYEDAIEASLVNGQISKDNYLKLWRQPNSGYVYYDASNGVRLIAIYRVVGAFSFSAQNSMGKGLYIKLYDSVENALRGASGSGSGLIKDFSGGSYSTSVITGESDSAGYLSFTFRKADDSAFSDSDKTNTFSNFDLELVVKNPLIKELNQKTDLINSGIADIFLTFEISKSKFSRTTVSAMSFAPSFPASTTRICTNLRIAIDTNYVAKVKITVTSGYKVNVRTATSSVWLSETGFVTSDTIVDIPGNADYLTFVVAKSDDSEITTDDYDKFSAFLQGLVPENTLPAIGIGNKSIHNGYMDANGKVNLITVGKHYVIDALPGISFYMKSNASRNTNYAFLKSYIQPTANGQSYDLCSGCSRVVVAANSEITATIPSDCKYVFISTQSDAGSHMPQSVKYDGVEITLNNNPFCLISPDMDQPIVNMFNHYVSETSLQGTVDGLVEAVSELSGIGSEKGISSIYFGELVQNELNAGGVGNASNYRVSQKCALALPYKGVKVTAHLPEGYCVAFKYGVSTTSSYISLSNDSGWLEDGESFTFDGNGEIYRAYFGKNEGEDPLTVAEVNNLIAIGQISITYLDNSGTIEERNAANESYIKGIMRIFTGTLADDDSLTKMPTFVHTSDVHGDVYRVRNFLDYADFLNVDAAFITGDLVPMSGLYDNFDYMDEMVDMHDSKTLLCLGNHDARGLSSEQAQGIVLAHTIEKYGLNTPSYQTYPTNYYLDFDEKKIRVISINQYEAGQYNTNNWRYTQNQINWFISTLANTPTGYGVIVLMHGAEVKIDSVSGKEKFFQGGNVTSYGGIKPITEIIDAFISKTTYSGSFEMVTSGATETITISCDFTGVNATTEFICYATGHRHYDGVGYSHDTNNIQLMLNICLGFALYGTASYHYYAEMTNVPRGGKGLTQDAFNLYCIDRTNKEVRIARVGSNMKSGFEPIDYMIIPYA